MADISACHGDGSSAESVSELDGASWRQAVTIGSRILFDGRGGQDTTDGEEAIFDARCLLRWAVGGTPLDFVKYPDRPLTRAQAAAYAEIVRRRAAGEPVSRIMGTRGFYGREYTITSATLDPRPESETLIDAALELMATEHGAGLEILDIGTGSGCLLVTLLAEFPAARGTGIDPSTDALAVAASNAILHGVIERCSWVEGRGFANLDRRFSLIVSNPPYIKSGDIAGLDREVRDHDPRLALDGGADGLDVYRAIARELDAHAAPGWVLLEVGAGQADAISDLMASSLLPNRIGQRKIFCDMAGMQRCVAFEIQK